MVATLQARKEALEAKILEKNEELKKLCLQEADLTGVIPPETPLEPGEPPPPIRRRVGTSFSFPQNLINNVKDADDESLIALELECKVQLNIAEAALALANDPSANKAARRKHRLMYRQSQRRLMELETRLNLLKQSKSQQIKKKPRPSTTAVENIEFFWKKNNEQNPNTSGSENLGSWPGKIKPTYSLDDCDKIRDLTRQNDAFASLQRSFKSGGTSQSSNSPKTDISNEEFKTGLYQLGSSSSFPNNFISGSVSYTNMQTAEANMLNLGTNSQPHKKVGKKGIVRRQWDTQSAGGTLLPSQTYPEHSHQPNLNRTQSLGSVESNTQKGKDSWSVQDLSSEENVGKDKEWYETSLDSAPSPPLRTTSRLPTMARMLYQMHEMQNKEWGSASINNLHPSMSHPVLSSTQGSVLKHLVKNAREYNIQDPRTLGLEGVLNSMQQMQLSPSRKGKNLNPLVDDVGAMNPKDFLQSGTYNESYSYPMNIIKATSENAQPQTEVNKKTDLAYPSTSGDPRYYQNNDNNIGLPLSRQNSLNQNKFRPNIEVDKPIIVNDNIHAPSNTTYANVPAENSDIPNKNWMHENEFSIQMKTGQIAVPQEYVPKPQTPTQPYYHVTKHSTGEKIKNLQYQAAKNRHASLTEEQINNKSPSPPHVGVHHPPHAIIQNEISFDTVVPFESPQNHTVVQAGKWQPYREVTKPFEMSDFYKYSTKFRQNQAQANRSNTPDVSGNSPNPTHQKVVYTPLKPMTCRPVESKSNGPHMTNQVDVQCNDGEKNFVEVSPPEIVLHILEKKGMKLFQCIRWTVNRRYSGYVAVSRPTGYKTVTRTKEDVSSLAKALHLKISANGPITVADYMKTCLTNPGVGYYMQKDAIGRDGDFITSPEVCQIFGELIGVWICNIYQKIGGSKPWQIIELGPGRGTLMADILRTLKVIGPNQDLSVHMVELSPHMAKIQGQTLCSDVIEIGMMPQATTGEPFYKSSRTPTGIPIYWYEKLENVPKAFSVVLAHEFFDALPIHKFQKHKNEWREVLINSSEKNGKYMFDYVLSNNESPMGKLLIDKNEEREHVEVSPEACSIASQVAQRLEESGGFSLFMDYGHSGEKTDTFRAFQNHKVVDPLRNPGMADLTADVDFSFLQRSMQDKAYIVGPIQQRYFLKQMKISSRLSMLLTDLEEKTAKQIKDNVHLLLKKDGMGSRYKFFAAFPLVLQKYLQKNPLPGFKSQA